jgi:predicted amidohydrolase
VKRLLQVVVFSSDTTIGTEPLQLTNLTASLDLPRRVAMLRRLVDEGYNACQLAHAQGLAKRNNGLTVERPLYLFVAPEYLLSETGGRHIVGKVRQGPHTEDAKEYLLRELATLSADYPDMILIPGSFTWKKSQARASEPPNEIGGRMTKAIKRVMLSPLSDGEKKAKLAVLQGHDPKIKQVAIWLAYSTAYVFYGGSIIHKYSKQVDAAEVSDIESDGGHVIFVPGDRSARFSVDGIDFALEICGEHAAAVRAHEGGNFVDVHVIVSATVSGNATNYIAKHRGWVVHADAYRITISQVARGHAVVANDLTAQSAKNFDTQALGGTHLVQVKQAETELKASLDQEHWNYEVPFSAYLKINTAILRGASAKMLQQTLEIV